MTKPMRQAFLGDPEDKCAGVTNGATPPHVSPKRKSPTKASGPVPFAPIFYLETTISVVDDSVCLTFHGDGDSVSEIWMPLSCAGTAGMALLETAFGADAARRIARRVAEVAERKERLGCSDKEAADMGEFIEAHS